MSPDWLAWGYAGLGLSAFLGATLLPLSSEATFAVALRSGLDPALSLLVASVCNGAAVLFNYWLGATGRAKLAPRTSGLTAGQPGEKPRFGGLERASRWFQRWGTWALLLSWLPVVGDPLTILAGVARVPFGRFAAICLPLRVARYVAIWAIWVAARGS